MVSIEREKIMENTEEFIEDAVCLECGWVGKEDDLVMDYYEQDSAMPLATLCPKCESETE